VRATGTTREGVLADLEAAIEKRLDQGETGRIRNSSPRRGRPFRQISAMIRPWREICDEAYKERNADVQEMKAFDTDILTEILSGNPAYADRIANVPSDEQAVPIVVIEEIIRGRFNFIRQAEAGQNTRHNRSGIPIL